MGSPAAIRNAATIIVLRNSPTGAAEVLLLRRHGRSGFAADAWVFPGGVVDPGDGQLPASRWTGIDPVALSERFAAPPQEVLAYHVAAVRETFEEAGLLLAHHADGSRPNLDDPHLLQLRRDLADRSVDVNFADWLEQQDLVLDLSTMTYVAWWLTPAAEPRRYDTRFFAARVPRGQTVDHDQLEITDQRWMTPADALREHREGRLQLIFPTIKTLEDLARHETIDGIITAAVTRPTIDRLLPHAVIEDGRLVRLLLPGDAQYPDHLLTDAT